jgi:hypothetical protein
VDGGGEEKEGVSLIFPNFFFHPFSVFVPTQLRKTKSLNITSVSRASGGFKLMMIGVENNDVC